MYISTYRYYVKAIFMTLKVLKGLIYVFSYDINWKWRRIYIIFQQQVQPGWWFTVLWQRRRWRRPYWSTLPNQTKDAHAQRRTGSAPEGGHLSFPWQRVLYARGSEIFAWDAAWGSREDRAIRPTRHPGHETWRLLPLDSGILQRYGSQQGAPERTRGGKR